MLYTPRVVLLLSVVTIFERKVSDPRVISFLAGSVLLKSRWRNRHPAALSVASSVANPFYLKTDPDSGSKKIIRIRIEAKMIRILIQSKQYPKPV